MIPKRVIQHLEKVDITTNPISDTSDPIDFTIDDSVGVFSDRKHDNNSNTDFNENPLDTYRCSASGTVLVNASCENEFISIAPGENFRPESLANDTLISFWKIWVSDKEKSISHVNKIF